MISVFADTSYWLARFLADDQWASLARDALPDLESVRLITSDYVLVEFLNSTSNRGPSARVEAVDITRRILVSPGVVVVEATRSRLLAGLDMYQRRADKQYSLVDCISMIEMRHRRIQGILSADHHFEQEGFTLLMKR